MYQFFVEDNQIEDSHIIVTGDDVNHMKNVLRMKIGEEVTASDGNGKEYICSIESMDHDQIILLIEDVQGSFAELPVSITLFQGYPKGSKMETIIQKNVELGVSEIVPVMMKRSIVKLDDKKALKKVERMQGIALAAAKQSKRGIVPEVRGVMTLKQAIAYASLMDVILVPYEDARGLAYTKDVLSEIRDLCRRQIDDQSNQTETSGSDNQKIKVGFFIGPEGGFDESEITMLKEIGGKTITLGNRILRTETAGMVMTTLIAYTVEE